MLSRLPFDRRAGRKHYLVYGFLLDYFHSEHGDALASVRHIVACLKDRDPFGNGLYVGDVHSALTDLVEWGYVTQEKGSGRRASRYVPVWGDVPSVRGDQNATDSEISVRGYPNTFVRAAPNATGASVRDFQNEDPLTGTRSQDPGTQKEGIDCAAASPPPASAAVAPAGAVPAQGGFEELWRAYWCRRGKAKARATYVKLNPSLELHRAMVARAKVWREAWDAQGNPDAPRMHLSTWIDDEHYDCDPPTGYRAKPKARTKAAPAPAPANDDNPPAPRHGLPVGRHTATIVTAEVRTKDGTKTLGLSFDIEGATYPHAIVLEAGDLRAQEDGQVEFQQLQNSVGVDDVNDPAILHGLPFILTVGSSGAVRYGAIAAAAA